MSETSTHIPQADPNAGPPPPPPAKLYSAGQLGLAALFGTIVASGWLARSNLRALGKERRGNAFFIGSLVVLWLLVAASLLLPESIPNAVFYVPQIAIAIQLGKTEFGAAFAHAERYSSWRVVGISLLWGLAFMAVGVAVLGALDAFGVPILEN